MIHRSTTDGTGRVVFKTGTDRRNDLGTNEISRLIEYGKNPLRSANHTPLENPAGSIPVKHQRDRNTYTMARMSPERVESSIHRDCCRFCSSAITLGRLVLVAVVDIGVPAEEMLAGEIL